MVIAITANNLKQSIDMLWMFASQNKETGRAVQHARTLKIIYLSPALMSVHPAVFPIPEFELERRDLSSTPPSLIRRDRKSVV